MGRTVRRGFRRGGFALAAASVVFAVGGIVLLRAPSQAAPRDERTAPLPPLTGHETTPPLSGAQSAASRVELRGPAISGHMAFAEGAVLTQGARRVLAELRLVADQGAARADARSPIALAIVLDVSGSMAGQKIEDARNAVQQLIERMAPADQVAFVTYSHVPQVVQPLVTVGEHRSDILRRVQTVSAGGGTMIPGALELGARAVQNAPPHLVRRMVLLSDGLDGSGLGAESVSVPVRNRAQAGVSLSALGIGADYDEHFMTTVADAGRGNYEFLQTGSDLATFLRRELDEASSTVVDQVVAEVTLPDGFRLTAAHGGEHLGQSGLVKIPIGPMSAGDRRRVVLDLSVEAGQVAALLGPTRVKLRYRSVADSRNHEVASTDLALRVVATEAEVIASRDVTLYSEMQSVVIDAEQRRAITAWRSGDVQTARAISRQNVTHLRSLQGALESAGEGGSAVADSVRARVGEYEVDGDRFQEVAPASAQGRAYGLRSNARRRGRARAF